MTLVGCRDQIEANPQPELSCSRKDNATVELTYLSLILRDMLEHYVRLIEKDSEFEWSRVQFDWEAQVGPLLDFEFVAKTGLMPENAPQDIHEGFEFLERIELTRDYLVTVAEAELETCLSARVDGASSRCAIVSASFREFSRKCQRHSERTERQDGDLKERASFQAVLELRRDAYALGASSMNWSGQKAMARDVPSFPGAADTESELGDLWQLRQISLAVKVIGALGPLGCEPVVVECPL